MGICRAIGPVLASLALAGCGGSGPTAGSAPQAPTLPRDGSLAGELDAIRARYGVPSLAGFALRGGQIVEQAAVGVRALGRAEAVSVADRWHIGSITKSMTATLAALLVEEGRLAWTTTVAEALPDLAGGMRAEHRTLRLEELLSHTAGVATDITRAPSWGRLAASSQPLVEQRRLLVAELLALPRDGARGSYAYSNGGFVVAGSMLEAVTGEPWEQLIAARLFGALGMGATGFGPPGTPGLALPDQPWGHAAGASGLSALAPGPAADNPLAIGPAGTVHSSFADLARYFGLHLEGARGRPTPLLTTPSFAKLHQPMPGTEYALGWGVATRSWAEGGVLQHHGSNGYWWASVWLAPNRDLGLFAVTNAAGDGAFAATDEAIVELIRRQGIPIGSR